MIDAKLVGETLRNLRAAKRLSMREVAEKVGITVSSLAMIERGERTPRDDVKVRLAHYYGQKVGELFYGE